MLLITLHLSLIANASYAATFSPYAIEKLAGQKAPDFTLKDTNGKPVALSSFKGKVILLNFWATWCPPCRDEIPSLNLLNRKMNNKGFAIVSVAADRSLSTVKDFIVENRVDFTVLFDGEQTVTKSLYKVFTIPTTFLIDRKGIIVEKFFGEQDWANPKIMKKIEDLL